MKKVILDSSKLETILLNDINSLENKIFAFKLDNKIYYRAEDFCGFSELIGKQFLLDGPISFPLIISHYLKLGREIFMFDNKVEFLNWAYNCLKVKEELKVKDNSDLIKDENILIINSIIEEVKRQEKKWGIQNHPILNENIVNLNSELMCKGYNIPTEKAAKSRVNRLMKRGTVTYMDILIEEISEAASCGNKIDNLKDELIQCGAVIISMLKSLERNKR